MSYTPSIILHWKDLKPEHFDAAEQHSEDDHESRAFWRELKEYLTDPKWIREFKGEQFVNLAPELTSHTRHYKSMLDEWGIEYFEIGG